MTATPMTTAPSARPKNAATGNVIRTAALTISSPLMIMFYERLCISGDSAALPVANLIGFS